MAQDFSVSENAESYHVSMNLDPKQVHIPWWVPWEQNEFSCFLGDFPESKILENIGQKDGEISGQVARPMQTTPICSEAFKGQFALF